MDQRQIQRIAERAGITVSQAEAAVALLREDYSIPFIARWRKDVTGNLNEHTLEHVRLLMRQEIALDNRRKSALEKLSQAGNHDSTLAEAIAACDDPLELDDLCITLRREKRRRPMSVSPKDFEPLADYLWEQECKPGPLDFFAEEFIRQPSIIGKVLSPEEAILRARHILAERLAEMPEVRKIARDKIAETAVLPVHATRYEGHQKARYASYAGLEKPLSEVNPEVLLAVSRADKIGALRCELVFDEEGIRKTLADRYVKQPGSSFEVDIVEALRDALRQILPELELQILQRAREHAETQLIAALQRQAESVLMTTPVGPVPVCALLPFKEGAIAWAALDASGQVLQWGTGSMGDENQAWLAELPEVCRKHNIRALVVGSSRASYRVGDQVMAVFRTARRLAQLVRIPEVGLTAYAADATCAERYPDLDLHARAAVCLGRRAQDPLRELLRMDPKLLVPASVMGLVNIKRLQDALFDVMSWCVCRVGMDPATAEPELLRYLFGQMGVAQELVAFREREGGIRSREQLKQVSGIGEKTWCNTVGFLRVTGSAEPLDGTRIHPEAYAPVREALENAAIRFTGTPIPEEQVAAARFDSEDPRFGPLTREDWKRELVEPFADPRGRIKLIEPRRREPEPIKVNEGDIVEGKVTNITEFGVFVNFGSRKEGLIHLSELSTHYVSDPHELLSVGQQVRAKVIKVEREAGRISLSLRALEPRPERPASSRGPERPAGDVPGRGARLEGLDPEHRERSHRRDNRPEKSSAPRDNQDRPMRGKSGHITTDNVLADQLAGLKAALLGLNPDKGDQAAGKEAGS